MESEEIIKVMSAKRSAALVNKYRIIYQIATGKPFRGCLCGNGFDNLWRVCKSYADGLIAKKKTNE